ncbi:hypothetical protein F5148DRAFT_1262442 [Russula earlei]|uniref:Uncharacterized protein n=1 Tax=Russula earlei TaxID=71964 RepID=A0ACC0TRS3_9AGAM|nr:hypothetical protein F5148DRAFT_1262442 [Russula earlei]
MHTSSVLAIYFLVVCAYPSFANPFTTIRYGYLFSCIPEVGFTLQIRPELPAQAHTYPPAPETPPASYHSPPPYTSPPPPSFNPAPHPGETRIMMGPGLRVVAPVRQAAAPRARHRWRWMF